MSRERDARHLRCGSCGEQALHFIVLNGFDVPACLRHLNVWKTPDFAAVPVPSECGLAVAVEALADELPKFSVLRRSHFGPPVPTVTEQQVVGLLRALLSERTATTDGGHQG